MDATRKTVPVVIAGRTINMWQMNESQIVGLKMMTSKQISEETKLGGLIELFLSLMPTEEDKEYLAEQLFAGGFSAGDIGHTLMRIATVTGGGDPDTAPVKPAKKSTAKRAARSR